MADELLHSIPRLWRGSRMPEAARRTFPTGFAELDRELPGGGWPLGAVIELLIDTVGIGELRLLLPALRNLSLAGNHILFIHPPYQASAPALHAAGIDLDRLLVIGTEDGRDILWAAEQALRNPACGAVLVWARDAGRQFSDDRVRRLQVAAQDGQSILFLYRMGRRSISRWAALRMELLPAQDGLQVSVLKAAGTHRRPQVHVRT